MGIHEREHLEARSAEELIAWLELNHESSDGLWVVTHKKASGVPAPTYDEIVRAILCFGWVDSVPGRVDELRTKLYVSPRKPKSPWSQSNKQRVAELLEAGLMRPAGLSRIEEGKATGMWTVIDSAQNAEIPDDLAHALTGLPPARQYWDAFPKGIRKQILEWISLAKTEATREKRIVETATLAQQNIRANQWRRQ